MMGMSSPQDNVARRMEALVDLLKAAATDDNVFLEKETQRCQSCLVGDDAGLPDDPQEWDDTLETLTRQLQDSLVETPEREEIEEVQPARVTYKPRGSSSKKQTRRDGKRESSPKRSKRKSSPPPPAPPSEHEPPEEAPPPEEPPVDRRAQLEREFSEMSYPKIGPGYSDSISVVSDLSIPTVVTSLDIPDEEHYGHPPMMQIGIRQPSIGSNQMSSPPVRNEDSFSRDESEPRQRRPGGAAAQRRQTHQAVLAHLQQSAESPLSPSKQRRGHANGGKATPTLTVNDFPALNASSTDEPSEYLAARKPVTTPKRRSLLRKSNKYAASVTATSTRMLLNKKSPNNKRYGLHRKSSQKQQQQAPAAMDVDGMLSTMNYDIDFIFKELSVLEDDPQHPQEQKVDDSNIGATAKIKYTLGSVARTLRRDGVKKQDSLLRNKDDMSWGSVKDKDSASVEKSDPLLIDEDGFIVSNDNNDDAFDDDPFAQKQEQQDLFAPQQPFGFFPASSKDTAPKRKSKLPPARPKTPPQETDQPNKLPSSSDSKESRIDAVESATKKRIEMLRKLVEYRARNDDSGSTDELQKLDFVEAETMKQIARLRDRLGESRRQLGDAP